MANRVSTAREGIAAAHRLTAGLGLELREARLARGLRLADIARAAGTSTSYLSRVERGLAKELCIFSLARYGTAVGLKLHARFYPTGGGLRDAAQLDLLRRLRARIGDRWSWQLEAPLAIPGDLRAFDALLRNGEASVAIEAITRLRDAQAQLRQAALKQRDGEVGRLVILVSGTNHNRAALASAADVLTTAFPLGTRATIAALTRGEDPGDNGIVLL